MDLDSLRGELNAVDEALVALFGRRMDIVARIAAYKREAGLPVLDAAREAAVLDRVAAQAGVGQAADVRRLYSAIFEISRVRQQALLDDGPRYGLVGTRLAHSLSPMIHAMLAPYRYDLFTLTPDDLAAFVRRPGLGGLNVTMPFKRDVLPMCDALSPEAARIGSVNTLVHGLNGGITGYNTDYAGFAAMADAAGVTLTGRKVVVLGSGGTARTVQAVCEDRGARAVVIVSRAGAAHYGNLDLHADAQVLVNTTPVGMTPDQDSQPVSLDGFSRLEGVLDVVYAPLRTRLVLAARRRSIPALGGLTMLVRQAAASATLFTEEDIPTERADATLAAVRTAVENIVLIGMPGCGKSCVGAALAAWTGRPLIDTDEEIVRRFGKPIPRIFAEDGEAAFRAAEREALAAASGRTGVIIATGGGSVLSEENRTLLAMNGRCIHLRRPLSLLAVAGRPLSVDVAALAQARMPVYNACADAAVDNDGTIDAAARRVWEVFACGCS